MTLGQQLLVSAKSPLDVIPQLITQHNVAKIYCSQNVGDYENRIWGKLSKRYPMIGFESIASHTLFTESELPFNVADLPDSFSKFRKAVEPLTIKPPIAEINSLPASPDIEWEWPQSRTSQISQPLFEGGEQQGLAHMETYFERQLASNYKETRNGLDGLRLLHQIFALARQWLFIRKTNHPAVTPLRKTDRGQQVHLLDLL